MKAFPVRFIALLIVLSSTLFSAAQDKYWIYFKDKGEGLHKIDWTVVEKQFTQRSLQRRAKVTPPNEPLLDMSDAPVWQPYLEALQQRGVRPVVISKWLNAVRY